MDGKVEKPVTNNLNKGTNEEKVGECIMGEAV